MNWGLTLSPASSHGISPSKSCNGNSSCVPYSSLSSNIAATHGSRDHQFCSWKLKYSGNRSVKVSGLSFRCNSSTNPGGPSGQAENETKTILDAFFLGKALAEALNERIESAVGEFLSTVGRLQAEQQKQVQDLQVEVLERAKRAKEKAAREVMEARGVVPKSSSHNVYSRTTSSTPNSSAPEKSSNESVQHKTSKTGNEDPLLGLSSED